MTHDASDALALPPHVLEWIGDVTAAQVERVDRRPGGARKEAWFVDVRDDRGTRELFLRYDRSDPERTGDPWTLRREATVYLALQGTDVLVPTVVALHPTEQAMLTERIEGENWFSRIRDPDEQVAVASDFMGRLAALHRLDPNDLELPGFPVGESVRRCLEHELDEWDRVIAFRGGRPDPGLRISLEWLRASIPAYDGPPVLVQGDTGPGNFMYADGKVVAVVDWELAHLGDPMDDIAWLSLRAVQEPFTHLPDRLAEYAQLSGNEIDEERVGYYRVMAETKLLVMSHSPAGLRLVRTGAGGGDVGNGLIYGVLHRRLWLEALARVMDLGEQRAELPPESPSSQADWLFDVVLGQLRDVVVPRVTDPLALQRTKGVARILKYLAAIQRVGPFYDQCELDDVTGALGERPADVEAGRAAMAAAADDGRISGSEYLQYLWRRVARDNELLRPASGVMADRHWPPLH